MCHAYLARARAVAAMAEAAADAGDQRTAAAYRSAAAAWERLAGPPVPWSLEPAHRELRLLKRELAVSTGPFQPPAPPRRPPPSVARPEREPPSIEARLHETIQF